MKASVGVWELKKRLGSCLRRVRRGATLVVTYRGEPIAVLRPLETSADDAGLAALEALGVVTRDPKARLGRFRPLRRSGQPVSEAVIEEREDRF